MTDRWIVCGDCHRESIDGVRVPHGWLCGSCARRIGADPRRWPREGVKGPGSKRANRQERRERARR